MTAMRHSREQFGRLAVSEGRLIHNSRQARTFRRGITFASDRYGRDEGPPLEATLASLFTVNYVPSKFRYYMHELAYCHCSAPRTLLFA